MTRALALAALMIVGGCAEDPLALAPFPCAEDGTCPEALTCAAGISAGAGSMCMASCTSSSECEEGARCAPVGDSAVCLAECTPFGTDCDAGTSCRMQDSDDGVFATCLAITAGQETMFGACESALDCSWNASCVSRAAGEPPACRPHCDAEHGCRRGMSCHALLPSGAGVCY